MFFLVRFYQYTFSYFFGGHCRFYPSCSEYALHCLEKYNSLTAIQKILFRLSKCHPLSRFKGFDPA